MVVDMKGREIDYGENHTRCEVLQLQRGRKTKWGQPAYTAPMD